MVRALRYNNSNEKLCLLLGCQLCTTRTTTLRRRTSLKIIVTSLFVQDQGRALEFYSEKLGFIKKEDVPVGEFRWITLVSPDDQGGTELLLEPNNHPAAKEYQQRIYADGIPATMFGVADIQAEYRRLKDKGVTFTMEPTKMGDITIAVFDDTCGNLIQIVEK